MGGRKVRGGEESEKKRSIYRGKQRRRKEGE